MAIMAEAKEEKAESTHSTSCVTDEMHMTIGVNGMEAGGNPAKITVGQACGNWITVRGHAD